jgi:regulatory protein YycH of two-component signal transduction system YycFG
LGCGINKSFYKARLLNGLLVLSLVISVVLTGFIFSSFGKNEAPDQSTAQQPEKQLLEIFRPTQYIVNQPDGSQQLVMNATDAKLKKYVMR